MFTNETWVINFASKQVNKHPQWNNKCKCCPYWLLPKYFFNNYKNMESLVKADKVPATIL